MAISWGSGPVCTSGVRTGNTTYRLYFKVTITAGQYDNTPFVVYSPNRGISGAVATGGGVSTWYEDYSDGVLGSKYQSQTMYLREYDKTGYISSGSAGYTIPAAQFTVTFNANGGTTPTASKTVSYGSTYGTLPTCSRTGYTFDGWYTAASGGTKITSASTVSITANQTLYAHWIANTYTGTFDLQGGKISGSAASVTKTETFDAAWVLPADPARDGYSFAGWYTAPTGGTRITGETVYDTAANSTLYARWTGNTVTCTYDARGGTVSPASKDVTVGGTYGELPTPVRAGYSFLGWFTTVNGNTQLTDTSTVTATANHTIYAHWEVQAILRIMDDGTVTATAAIYAVEGGTVRQIVAVYEVDGGTVHQGV